MFRNQLDRELDAFLPEGDALLLLQALQTLCPIHSVALDVLIKMLSDNSAGSSYTRLSSLEEYGIFARGKNSKAYYHQWKNEFGPTPGWGFHEYPYHRYHVDQAFFVIVHPVQKIDGRRSRWVSIGHHLFTNLRINEARNMVPVLTLPGPSIFHNPQKDNWFKFNLFANGDPLGLWEKVKGVQVVEQIKPASMFLEIDGEVIRPDDSGLSPFPYTIEAYLRLKRRNNFDSEDRIWDDGWHIFGISLLGLNGLLTDG